MRRSLYILRCRDGAYYVGSTTNLDDRLAQHQAGMGGGYTAQRLPVSLVYSCEFASLHEAFLRERQVKGWARRKKEALIQGEYGDYAVLVRFAKSRGFPSLSRDPSTGSG